MTSRSLLPASTHQQAQAFELLTELPEWIDLEKALDACISLKSIEARWGQFHQSDVSPLIKAMLETNLLQINGLGGGVRFPQPLIRDYLLSMVQVNRLRSTNPVPPRGIALTNWLHWMVCHWLDSGDHDRAGTTLWNAVGTLPGFNSGAWVQLGLVLADLPDKVMREPFIWLLASIVREAAQYNLHSRYYLQGWLAENMSSPMDARVSIDIQQSEFARILKGYGESLRRYHSIVSHDATCNLEIALGYDPSCRSDHWIRKHALSALMTLNPEKEVEIRLLPFVYQPKQLCEVILDYARKEFDWELELAACESLVSWGVQESKAILAESKITELPNEYYHRSVILRNALEGRPGYANWV